LLQVWEAMSGRIQQNYNGPGVQIASVSWSPDGQRLVSGGDEDQVRVWERATGRQIFVYSGHVAPDPAWMPIAPNAYGTSTLQPTLSHREITAVAWSPDGHWIVSGDSDNTIHVWGAD